MKILIVNSQQPHCGVYQYGKRLALAIGADIADVGSRADYDAAVASKEYDAVVLNFHQSLFPWWVPIPGVFYIYHENPFPFPVDKAFVIDSDPTAPNGIPRPLYIPKHLPQFMQKEVPVFGSFGFGFSSKYFEQIVQLVQNEYDEAIIRFAIPFAYHGDVDGHIARDVASRCMARIHKKGVRLQITHSFLTDEELIGFLASNDMNIFLYEAGQHRGCSSVLDFAIPAKRPFAISDSRMFRHVYSDEICAYRRPLRAILADGVRPIGSSWTPDALTSIVADRISSCR